ncbi:alpha/beta fold hydrolase [Novosphingobium sp. YJ-S2-02]|uniref:Alpha/beta fold hydrolase n=1 Tax=Novosphingobium aureum TaxID=2792964 RepID=A0A931HFI4_9SPHN|nr:alpha/beta fold hydrolase [Novosphingobium aureum]MBH0115197.1 alpha/beta fold hydrolase [Novosphingobium aureum]
MPAHINPTIRSTAMDLAPALSMGPLSLRVEGRGENLAYRVTAPAEGDSLPLILFAHGNGQSLYTYGPLVNYWASNGFVVINPTHLDSRMIALPADDPRRPQLWRHREQDILALLDNLDTIEEAAPFIKGRIDRDRIAVAGHSWGAQTASMFLGATHPDPDDGSTVSLRDARVKAGVLFAVPGTGGENLSEFAAQNFPFMHPDFSGLETPTLVVAGDNDNGAMTVRGPDWWREAYDLSPGAKALFEVKGGEHSLGGIPNYEARETTDENPARVAAVQQLSTAFLRSTLSGSDAAWKAAVSDVRGAAVSQGTVEEK